MAAGVPHVALVGLPDAVVRQSVDRVRAAVVNAGQKFPQRRITIGLSRASMPKQGSGFDLALAAALLAASGAVPHAAVDRLVLLGELGLDGSVRGIRGVLPAVLAAARAGHAQVVVAEANADEAALVDSVEVLAVGTLVELVAHLRGRARLSPHTRGPLPPPPPVPDLADVVGQDRGRCALEVAAAGGHHLALFGPPGAGKTMLAQRLPSILPPLDDAAALEVTAVHSIAGTLPPVARLVRRPTFQAPHHTATWRPWSAAASGLARPGALCLAHRGVLFLDEAPEFRRRVLNALRQPLEDGWVTLARSQGTRPTRPGAAGTGREPVPVRGLQRHRLHLLATGAPSLPGSAVRTAARPHRPAGDLAPVSAAALTGVDDQVCSEQVLKRVLAARAAAAERWPAPAWWQQPVRPPLRAAPAAVAAAGRAGAGPRHTVGPRLRPGAAHRLDHRRPAGPHTAHKGRHRRGAAMRLQRCRHEPTGYRDGWPGSHWRTWPSPVDVTWANWYVDSVRWMRSGACAPGGCPPRCARPPRPDWRPPTPGWAKGHCGGPATWAPAS